MAEADPHRVARGLPEVLTDIDIMEIADPRNPVRITDELDLVALFGVDQESPST